MLAKSPAVWYQPDVDKVLERHKQLLPGVKILCIVRDPIVRLVSDVVHYNSNNDEEKHYHDIDSLILNKTLTRPYYPGLSKRKMSTIFYVKHRYI